jgi:hypothetical protein
MMGPKKVLNTQPLDRFVAKDVGEGGEETPEWAKTLLSEIRESLAELRSDLRTHVSDSILAVEGKIDAVKQQLEEKIEDLEFNSRKYNLLLWGLGPTTSENCQSKVNAFLKSELGFDSNVEMAACHPLKGDTVIMRFIRMSDRDQVLKSGTKLKGKKFSLKTDLPPRLRALRQLLRSEAKKKRDEGKMMRVIEKGKGVYLQEKHGNSWRTV